MARKQSTAAEADQKPATNSAEPVRAKTAAIRELYAEGVRKPKEISEAMTSRGLSVSMPVIYTTLKKLKKGGKGKPGRKPKTTEMTAAETAPANVSTTMVSITYEGVTTDDLRQLAEITKKVGGIDAAVGLLNVLKNFQ